MPNNAMQYHPVSCKSMWNHRIERKIGIGVNQRGALADLEQGVASKFQPVPITSLRSAANCGLLVVQSGSNYILGVSQFNDCIHRGGFCVNCVFCQQLVAAVALMKYTDRAAAEILVKVWAATKKCEELLLQFFLLQQRSSSGDCSHWRRLQTKSEQPTLQSPSLEKKNIWKKSFLWRAAILKHPQQPLLGISKPNLRFNRDNIKLKLESVQVDILLPVVYQSPTKLSEEAAAPQRRKPLCSQFVWQSWHRVGTK